MLKRFSILCDFKSTFQNPSLVGISQTFPNKSFLCLAWNLVGALVSNLLCELLCKEKVLEKVYKKFEKLKLVKKITVHKLFF